MKNKVKVLVIGSGAGGLGSAAWLKKFDLDFMVVDSAKELPLNLSNGVHYLHSIPELPFETDLKEITLTDGILEYGGKIKHKADLNDALCYSEKVREIQHPSSIMDIGERKTVFMPKSNDVNKILRDCYEYADPENFQFGFTLQSIDVVKKVAVFMRNELEYRVVYEHIISTVPLDKFSKMTELPELAGLKFDATPIYITNYSVKGIVPNWMINLYIPDADTSIYRASILNGICSVESIRELRDYEIKHVRERLRMFHLVDSEPTTFTWKTGKVVSISIDDRIAVVNLFKGFEIYQIGRFGLWNRKLLIDSTIEQAKTVVRHIARGDLSVEHPLSVPWNDVEEILSK